MTYEGVIQATHEGLVAINPNGDIYLINDSAKRLLGVESEQLSVIATWLQGISEQEKMRRILTVWLV